MIKVLLFLSAGLLLTLQTEAPDHFGLSRDKEMIMVAATYHLFEGFTKAPADTDTIPEPEYFETPVPEDVPETHAPGRIAPVWWILILALALLAAFYYKGRGSRNKK
jgi:hypothetical protein